MLNRIIRIAAAACALLLTAGCTARLDPAQDGSLPISFDAGSRLLRDDATKVSAYYDDTSFGVFAFKQSGGTWSQLASKHWKPNYMFNQEVHCLSGVYTYSPIRFWPDPSESTLSFWAYSPYQASPTLYKTGTTPYTSNSEGLPDVRFTVDGHTDLLVSDVVEDQVYASNSGVVPIEFNHILSLIDVNVNKQDPLGRYTVKLKSVRLDGLFMTAVLRSSSGDWDTWSGSRQNITVWADDPDSDSDDIVLATSPVRSLTGVMPIPQSLSNAATRLHVEFSVWYEGILHERETTREVLLSNIFTSGWEVNSHYTLNITISPDDPIEFTVTWDDWGSESHYHLTS